MAGLPELGIPISSPMSPRTVTQLLDELDVGGDAADRLAEAVHGRLLEIAAREMRRRGARPGALTIEPGVLANDALMAVLDRDLSFENRRLFYAYATKIIVRQLIDHQRRRGAAKRGGDQIRITFDGARRELAPSYSVEQVPAALEELSTLDERKAEVVQLRVFWGMTVPEVARTLGLSESTVDRDWRFAHRWLANRLRDQNAGTVESA